MTRLFVLLLVMLAGARGDEGPPAPDQPYSYCNSQDYLPSVPQEPALTTSTNSPATSVTGFPVNRTTENAPTSSAHSPPVTSAGVTPSSSALESTSAVDASSSVSTTSSIDHGNGTSTQGTTASSPPTDPLSTLSSASDADPLSPSATLSTVGRSTSSRDTKTATSQSSTPSGSTDSSTATRSNQSTQGHTTTTDEGQTSGSNGQPTTRSTSAPGSTSTARMHQTTKRDNGKKTLPPTTIPDELYEVTSFHPTTNYARTTAKPTTTGRPTTSRKTTPAPTTNVDCSTPCPVDYFEGIHGCLYLMNTGGTYNMGVSKCQSLTNGDMISFNDLKFEFDALHDLMTHNTLVAYRWFVNGFQSDLSRKEKKAQVIWTSASSAALISNDSIVARSDRMDGVGTICKIPKFCLEWTCPTAPSLIDSPYARFSDPQPPAVLNFKEKLHFECKDQSVVSAIEITKKFEAICTQRGTIHPSGSSISGYCKSQEKPAPQNKTEKPIPGLTCSWCYWRGTHHCSSKKENGVRDRCVCKEGWSGQQCTGFPKFCPSTWCPKDAKCEERIDHAVCVCETDRCVVTLRQTNRTQEMKVLDAAVMWAGPSIELILRILMQIIFPNRCDSIQESLQFMRTVSISTAGILYIVGADPHTLGMEIAERRFVSLFYHFPALLIHVFFALEMLHIDRCLKGRSDNKWKTARNQRNRWDYGRTYGVTIVCGLAVTLTIWYCNWETHQQEYSSIGTVNGNLGMVGWMGLCYLFCCIYSFWKGDEILRDTDRRRIEFTRRDNKYECSRNPKLVEREEMVWRNLVPVMVGAPIQFAYSISLLLNLVYDYRELKYANLALVFFNSLASVMQSIRCDRVFLGRVRSWNMERTPLVEQFNPFNWLTTSEIIAKKGREEYEDLLKMREEAEIEKKKEEEQKNEEEKRRLTAKGIPSTFHPHLEEDGPVPFKQWNYDPCLENALSAREREWKYNQWTKEYLLARVRVGISVEDACEHVRNLRLDDGFLAGEECPSEQAKEMFKEWADMMDVQDRMDFAAPNRFERRFIDDLPRGLRQDLEGLPLESRIKEAPIHPKKKRLVQNIVPMLSFSCPEEREIGLAMVMDPYGLPQEVPVARDLPVITRAQEERVMRALKRDNDKDNLRWNKVYSDDIVFREVKDEPFYEALKEEFKIVEAFPEGPQVKSINPRKCVIDEKYFDQRRPDFIGPKEASYHVPVGPLLNRYWLEVSYGSHRQLMWDHIHEATADRRHAQVVRQQLRDHINSCRDIACPVCNRRSRER